MKDTEQEQAIKEWSNLFIDRSEPSVRIASVPPKKLLTARQFLAEAQENKASQEPSFSSLSLLVKKKLLKFIDGELDCIYSQPNYTVGDRLAILTQVSNIYRGLQ